MLALVCCACLAICLLLWRIRKLDNCGERDSLCAVCVWVAVVYMIFAWHMGKNQTPAFQYVPAEYIAENETSTYFGTEDGNIFYVDRMPLIDKDIPYLLGMDTNGTSDITDDEIITVWGLYE